MFKKRAIKKRNPIEIVEQTAGSDQESLRQTNGHSEEIFTKPASMFRKRDVKAASLKHYKVTTATQDVTSKAFMQREVQDLTNNYKSSSQARAAIERNR